MAMWSARVAAPRASGREPPVGGRDSPVGGRESPGRDAALAARLRRAERRQKLRALALVLPALVFVVLCFALPITRMLAGAVRDDALSANLPRTERALAGWSGDGLPGEDGYAALAADLRDAWEKRTAGAIGKRINYELPGAQSRVAATARRVGRLADGPYKDALIGLDPLWGGHAVWALIKRGASPYTPLYLMRSMDLGYGPDGAVAPVPPEAAVFRTVFARTFLIAVTVTFVTVLLGFPLAYYLATRPPRTANLLMILVLLPFWTSLLVRTTAWVVLLQPGGPINGLLMALHVVSEPLDLIFNRFSTVVAMTYIQLPFTLLPIYSVMRSIPPSYVRAARSLGAGPFYAFWTVYVPQTLPGIGAGSLLSFILCLGFYITPALVGGPRDQMLSSFIAFYTNQELNWGMASALGGVLLVSTLVLYGVYIRLLGVDRVRLG